jgi:ADP-heptose:LPS heptosyltransferase
MYDNNFFIPREQFIKRLQINTKKYIIEVTRAGALGDVLMSTAVCKAIKESNPGCVLRFVTHIDSAPILLNNPYIDEIATRGYPDAKKKVYLTYPEEAGIGKLSGHLIDRFAACAKLKNVSKAPSLHLSQRDMVLYDSYIDSAKDAPLCKPYVTIHTTAGWSPYKNWPIEFYNELSVKIKLFGQNVIQVGHESDLKCENSIDYRGKDIRQQFGLLSKSMLHIGIDSVYMHAAKALGVKSVIMWGSTSPGNYGYEDNVNIFCGFDCQPCNRKYAWAPRYVDDCPNNAKCMSSITPDQVFEFVKNIITKKESEA